MPTFEYSATTADGQVTRGQMFSTSMDQAMADLRKRGLEVQQIGIPGNAADPLQGFSPSAPRYAEPGGENVAAAPEFAPPSVVPPWEPRSYMASSVWGPLAGKVPLVRLTFFFRQFATMTSAGVPLIQSLQTLSGQAHSEKLTSIILEMRANAEIGRPVSVAMQRYPEVFPPVVMSLVRAGEETGLTDESYNIIADYLDREIVLRNLYKRVTFWPKLELGFSFVIIIVANMIISAVGGTEKLNSPLTTWQTWIWLGPLIVFLFLFVRVGLANARIKFNWDLVIVKIPGFGKILRELAMAKFGRAFGAVYKAGIPVSRALTLAANACGNEYLRARMAPAYKKLEEGYGISETFRETGAFSPIVLDMVHTGETTGNLDQMLNKMADFYEEEAATKAHQVGLVFGVVVFLCVAIYIAMIVINFFMAHYSGVSAAGG